MSFLYVLGQYPSAFFGATVIANLISSSVHSRSRPATCAHFYMEILRHIQHDCLYHISAFQVCAPDQCFFGATLIANLNLPLFVYLIFSSICTPHQFFADNHRSFFPGVFCCHIMI